MSIFEALMLICFGASWPMSIYKTVTVKNPVGKSMVFLWLVLIGYMAGCIHKVYYKPDWVLWLYVINALMVATDIFFVSYYNRKLREKTLTHPVAAD